MKKKEFKTPHAVHIEVFVFTAGLVKYLLLLSSPLCAVFSSLQSVFLSQTFCQITVGLSHGLPVQSINQTLFVWHFSNR